METAFIFSGKIAENKIDYRFSDIANHNIN